MKSLIRSLLVLLLLSTQAAHAAELVLHARRTTLPPEGAEIERVYFEVDHFKTKRVFVKVRAHEDGRLEMWRFLLPRSVWYDTHDYRIYYEAPDMQLYTLSQSGNHPFAPPGYSWKNQPSVELSVDDARAFVRFDTEKVSRGPTP